MSETTTRRGGAPSVTGLDHRLRRMTARNPDEPHRTATPLELFFDLVFVAAFSQAGNQTAHLLELGHFASATFAFVFAAFAISWAWINYAWFASAYDNDDVFFRVATMMQMIGVIVLALGLPETFRSIDEGGELRNGIVVIGYIIMRVAVLALWIRAAMHDPEHRRTAIAYVVLISISQIGWIALLVMNLPLDRVFVLWLVLVAFELAGPIIAERIGGRTPWHAHHIAERYGLLVIITLGEIVLGTIVAISAVVEEQGWDLEAVLVTVGGTMLAFGLWWVYFIMPSAKVLARHRERGWMWGYGHIVLFGALAATGAGLHVAAYVIEGVAHIDDSLALLTVVVPVSVFSVALFTLYTLLLREFDPFHILLFVGSIVPLVVAAWLVAAGASIGTGIVIAAFSPIVVAVGYETIGHRHQAAALERALA
ncbi:low temperature requirement protein LtrA [Agromyces flavus]|uniref:Low temperature requirement protein LtrA n=1 Tax=Agromyces flavus TaxID=589382 RepID=A0A1H1TSX4_9MICO|nr:low temperature requirement protein A [Agromyces flavus]MCP2368364.1 low temperature requirement protein LtrA [Agromyces flavus]GGI47825.1 membrane protein [Agromyces flavus]SDS63308.1 Low temperature requirement protein LtrA [Agromyces flavus]